MTARRALVLAAVGWAVAAGLLFAIGPVYSSRSETLDVAEPGAPAAAVREWRASGLSVNGAKALPALLVPVLIAAAPLLRRRGDASLVTGVAAALMLAFVVVGSFSIGLLYLPSAVALVVAAALPAGKRHRP